MAAEWPQQITREHVDNIRQRVRELPNRTPDNHEILLEFGVVERRDDGQGGDAPIGPRQVKLAQLIIKSGSRNALSGKMIAQLTDRLDELERWLEPSADDLSERDRDLDARCLLVRGSGNTFCSGSDLKGVRETLTQPMGWELAQLMQYNLARLERLPLVSVAFIQGYALGGGAELALAADLRLMTDSAKLGFVHARNGICCGWGGGARLIELLGRSRALEVLASGRAHRTGARPRTGPLSEARGLARRGIEWALEHAIESRRVSRAIKRLVTESGRLPYQAALQLEAQLFAHTWGKEAHLRALCDNLKHK